MRTRGPTTVENAGGRLSFPSQQHVRQALLVQAKLDSLAHTQISQQRMRILERVGWRVNGWIGQVQNERLGFTARHCHVAHAALRQRVERVQVRLSQPPQDVNRAGFQELQAGRTAGDNPQHDLIHAYLAAIGWVFHQGDAGARIPFLEQKRPGAHRHAVVGPFRHVGRVAAAGGEHDGKKRQKRRIQPAEFQHGRVGIGARDGLDVLIASGADAAVETNRRFPGENDICAREVAAVRPFHALAQMVSDD